MTTSPTIQLIEPLSASEREVLRHMADGLSDQEIADALLLSVNTVRIDHKQHIYDKLGLEKPHRNKKWAIYCARQLGLLDGDSAPITDSTPTPQLMFRQRHNLPTQLIPFVGREAEIADVQKLLTEHRLITILATGGMGKTRLALEVAQSQLDTFKDGVYFVPLQALSDAETIPSQIASSTGFQLNNDTREAKQQILDFLGNKRMLLVMDNFEHLLEGAPIVHEILVNAPDVKIITTSREKLNLIGEISFTLKGMHFPTWETPEDALRYDAVQLLVQSARRVKPDWTVTQENLDYVARVCRLTQGMPLAILLAMSWIDMLSVQEIADEIQSNVDFLAGEMRNMPDRQQSIRAIFETTWNRLTPDEQAVFAQMSIFRGGFTIKAVKAITGASLRTLQGLTNKALIQKVDDDRYDLHELLRQYAEQHLNLSGETDNVKDQHMRYYAAALKREAPRLFGQERLDAIENIDRDIENLRVTWLNAFQKGVWNLVDDMFYRAPLTRGTGKMLQLSHEMVMQLTHMLQVTSEWTESQERLFMRIATFSGPLDAMNHTLDEQESTLRRALKLAIERGEIEHISILKNALGGVLTNQSRFEEALPLYKDALELAYQIEDPYVIVNALLGNGFYHMLRGDLELVKQNRYEILRIARQTNNIERIFATTEELGRMEQWLDNWKDGHQLLEDALRHYTEFQFEIGQMSCLMGLSQEDVLFMRADSAQQRTQKAYDLAEHRHEEPMRLFAMFSESRIYFIRNEINRANDLCEPFYQLTMQFGKRDVVTGVSRWKSLSNALLGNLSIAVRQLTYVIPYDLEIPWNSMLILNCMAFLPMLQDQGDDLRSVELVAMFNEHPKALPISSQHPYVLELQSQLQDRLDADIYQQAWQRGAQLDPLEVAPALLEEFTAIYG